MDCKQSRMLQVAGIILIIWGIVRGSLSLAVLVMDIDEITPVGIIMIQGFDVCCDMPLLELVPWATIITELLLFLFGVAADVFAGIKGVTKWKEPEHANRCLLWGIVAVVVNVMVMFILEVAAGIGSLAIHMLYIIGAWRLKKDWHTIEGSA